tara:strand:- start:141 stop:995 length:855 start_codon:yes stop_codon:yes gene_type:complete
MKKTCIIAAYFGDLPYYFPLWEESAQANPEINWLIFTDKEKSREDKNIKYVNTTLKDISKLASKKLDEEINLKKPYKICDLRPAFAVVFDEYLKGYDFWGHCDLDVIWGDIKKFLGMSYVWENDIITADRRRLCGPFCLFKNEEKTNSIYKQIDKYIEGLNSENPGILDELEFKPVKEKGRCDQTLNVEKFKIFCGHEYPKDFITLQRYSSERTPAYWNSGSLFVEKYFKSVVANKNSFYGFGAETMLLHVRPWHYVDLEYKSIYHKDESKEILEKWKTKEKKS